jgi:hypothetical protein
VQLRDQLGKSVQRIGDGAAERAGVQIDGRPAQGDLGIGQSAHRRHRAGQVGSGHPGVADHDDVAEQPLGPLVQEVREVR